MNKSQSKINNIVFILCISLTALFFQSCSQHKTKILVGGIVGAAVGAGLGYGVVHHGQDRQYEVQNTIITSGVLAITVMGAMALHYHMMDEQKVDIMSNLTSKWIEKPENQNKVMKLGAPEGEQEFAVRAEQMGKYALALDPETRWVYPTFRKRYLRPETSNEQITSSRFSWEVVRPGFFVSKETHPWYFEEDVKVKLDDEAAPAIKSNSNLKKIDLFEYEDKPHLR